MEFSIQVRYCHRYHQTIDWKVRHKQECKHPGKEAETCTQDTLKKLSVVLFPQREILMDAEDQQDIENVYDSSDDEDDSQNQSSKDEDVETFKDLETSMANLPADEISKYVGNDIKMDKKYTKFRKIIQSAPDQVIRYQRTSDPLWISSKNIPEIKDIPNCQFCGTRRTFEFQIMPQMLNNLCLDGLSQDSASVSDGVDWGVLCVYTCNGSCNEGPSYKQEFLWKQNLSEGT